MRPLISVVMSVYNDEKYLPASIESILNQTFYEFEFIIIDDCSTDNSSRIVKSYQEKDKRIIFVNNLQNIGLAKSLNIGIDLSQGIYFARQDADDVSDKNRLQIQYDFIKSNTGYQLIGSDCGILDIKNDILYNVDLFSRQNGFSPFQLLLSGKSLFPHGSVMMDLSYLRSFKGYDDGFYFSQDRELWLRMCNKGASVYVIPQPLYYFRKKPLKHKHKKYFRSKVNLLLNDYYSNRLSEIEFRLKVKELFISWLKDITINQNSYYLSDYWYSIGLGALRSENKFKIWRYLKLSLCERNNFLRIIIRVISFILPFLPYSFSYKFRGLIKNFKSNT